MKSKINYLIVFFLVTFICSSSFAQKNDSLNLIFGKWKNIDFFCLSSREKEAMVIDSFSVSKKNSRENLKQVRYLFNGMKGNYNFTKNSLIIDEYEKYNWKINKDTLETTTDSTKTKYLILKIDNEKLIIGSLDNYSITVLVPDKRKCVKFDKDEFYIVSYYSDFFRRLNKKVYFNGLKK